MSFNSAIDSLLSVISPSWALGRTEARLRFQAMQRRSAVTGNGSWRPTAAASTSLNPNDHNRAQRTSILQVARLLDEDTSWAHGFFNSAVDNIVGEGFEFESRITRQRGEGLDEKRNRHIEDAYRRWADKVDPSGKESLGEQQRLSERELWVAGETLTMFSIPSDQRQVQLATEVIDGERLDGQMDKKLPGGGVIVQGVEFDAHGAIVAYWILPNAPSFTPSQSDAERIPADRVLHTFHRFRPEVVRGMSRIAPVHKSFRGFASFMDNELTASAMRSAFVAILKRQGLEELTLPETDLTGTDLHGNRTIDLRGGGFLIEGGPEDSIEGAGPTIQVGDLEAFATLQLRSIAAGLNVSYELLARDFTKTNFSSARQSALEDRRHWEPRQSFLIRRREIPVYRRWSSAARIAGVTNLKDDMLKVQFRRPGWAWVKPLEEVQAVELQLALGLTNHQAEAARRGTDFDENMRLRSEAEKKAKKFGIKLGSEKEPDPAKKEGEGTPGAKPKPKSKSEGRELRRVS
jgi:lambda family phage portal protein